jgi:hypothetical protein
MVPGCGPARDPNVDELKIGAYSVVREVLHEGLLPAFAVEWKRRTGRDFRFDESYLGSGAGNCVGLRCGCGDPVARGGHGDPRESRLREADLERCSE